MLHDLESAAPGGASDSKSTARAKKLFAAMDSDQKRSNSSTETDAFDRKLSDQQSAKQFTAPLFGTTQSQQPSNAVSSCGHRRQRRATHLRRVTGARVHAGLSVQRFDFWAQWESKYEPGIPRRFASCMVQLVMRRPASVTGASEPKHL